MNSIRTDNEVNISNRAEYQQSHKGNNEKNDKRFYDYGGIVIIYPAHHGSLGKLNRHASSTSLSNTSSHASRNPTLCSPRITPAPATISMATKRASISMPPTVSRPKPVAETVSNGHYAPRPTSKIPYTTTMNLLSHRHNPSYSNRKQYETRPLNQSFRRPVEEENVDESQFYFNRGANKTPWIFGERPFGLTRQEIKEKAKLRCHQRSQMFKADYDARQRALETNPEGVERDRQSKEHIKFLQDEYWNNKALSTKIRSFLEDRKKRGKISPGDYSLKETYGPRANGKTFWKLREKDVSSFQVEILPATKNVEFRLFYKKIGDFNWMKPEKEQICLLHPQFYDDFLARNVLTTGLNGLDVRNYASFYNNESKRFIVPVSNEEQHWFVHLGIDSKNKIRLQEVNSAVKTEQFLPDEGLRKIISILFGNKALKKNGEWRSINCVKTAEKSIQKQESPEQSDVLNVRNLEAMLKNRKFNKTLRDYRPKLMDDPYEDLKDIVRKERVRLANELKEIQNQQATYEERLKQPSPVESADTSKLLNRLLKWFKPKTPRNLEKQSQTAGSNKECVRVRSGARKHKIHRFLPKLDTIEENIEDETIEKYIDTAIGLSAEEKQQMRDHTDEQKVAHLEFHQDGFRLRSYKPEARPKPNDEQQRGGLYPLPGAEMEKNDESETPSSPEENNNASVEPDERNAEIVQVDTPTTTNRVRNQLATSSSVVNATAVESKQRNAGIVQTLNTNTNARVQAATQSTYQTRSSTTAANIDFVANEAAIIQAADTPVEARMSLGDIRLRWTYGPDRTNKDERLKKVYGRTKAAYGRLFLLDDADDNETRNAESPMSNNAVFRLLYSVVGDHNTNEDKVFHTLIHPSFITEHFDVEESERRTLLAALPEYTSFPNSKPTRRIILPIYRLRHFALAVFGLDSQGFVRVQIMDSMIDGSERMLSDSEAKELACHFFTVNEDEVIIERGTIQQVQKQKSGSQDCGVFTVINTKRYLNYVGSHLMEMATMMNLDKAGRIRDTSITRETLANDLKELAAKDMIHANQTLGIQCVPVNGTQNHGTLSSSTPVTARTNSAPGVSAEPNKTNTTSNTEHSEKIAVHTALESVPQDVSFVSEYSFEAATMVASNDEAIQEQRERRDTLSEAEMEEKNESGTPSSAEEDSNAAVDPQQNVGTSHVVSPNTTNQAVAANQSAVPTTSTTTTAMNAILAATKPAANQVANSNVVPFGDITLRWIYGPERTKIKERIRKDKKDKRKKTKGEEHDAKMQENDERTPYGRQFILQTPSADLARFFENEIKVNYVFRLLYLIVGEHNTNISGTGIFHTLIHPLFITENYDLGKHTGRKLEVALKEYTSFPSSNLERRILLPIYRNEHYALAVFGLGIPKDNKSLCHVHIMDSRIEGSDTMLTKDEAEKLAKHFFGKTPGQLEIDHGTVDQVQPQLYDEDCEVLIVINTQRYLDYKKAHLKLMAEMMNLTREPYVNIDEERDNCDETIEKLKSRDQTYAKKELKKKHKSGKSSSSTSDPSNVMHYPRTSQKPERKREERKHFQIDVNIQDQKKKGPLPSGYKPGGGYPKLNRSKERGTVTRPVDLLVAIKEHTVKLYGDTDIRCTRSTAPVANNSNNDSGKTTDRDSSDSKQIASKVFTTAASFSNTPVTPKSGSPQSVKNDSDNDSGNTTDTGKNIQIATNSKSCTRQSTASISKRDTKNKTSAHKLNGRALAPMKSDGTPKVAVIQQSNKRSRASNDTSSKTSSSDEKDSSDSKQNTSKVFTTAASFSNTPVTPKSRSPQSVKNESDNDSGNTTDTGKNIQIATNSKSCTRQSTASISKRDTKNKTSAHKLNGRALAPMKNDGTPKVAVIQQSNKRYRASNGSSSDSTASSQLAKKKTRMSPDFSTPGPSTSPNVKHSCPVNVSLKSLKEVETDTTLVLDSQTFTKFPYLPSCSLRMPDIATLGRGIRNNENVLTFAYSMNMEKYLDEKFRTLVFLAPNDLFSHLVIKRQNPRVDYTLEDLENPDLKDELRNQLEKNLYNTNHVAIFKKDALVFPINMGSHWATAVILNPIGAVSQPKKTKSKVPCTIVIFNSMENTDFNAVVAMRLKQWLEVCFDKQYHEDGAKFMENEIIIAVPKGVPQQNNKYDCGPFSCNFASNIFNSFEYLIEQNRTDGKYEWTKMSKVVLIPATVRQQLFDDIMAFANNEARAHVNGYDWELGQRETCVSEKTTECKDQSFVKNDSDNDSGNTTDTGKNIQIATNSKSCTRQSTASISKGDTKNKKSANKLNGRPLAPKKNDGTPKVAVIQQSNKRSRASNGSSSDSSSQPAKKTAPMPSVFTTPGPSSSQNVKQPSPDCITPSSLSDSSLDSITPPSTPQSVMQKTPISPAFSTPGPSTSLNPNPVNVQHPNPVNVPLKSLQEANDDRTRVLNFQTFTKFPSLLSSTNLQMLDIASLAEGEWNNDMVITYAYQMNMEKHLKKEFENSIFLVPSFLFPLLDAVNNQLQIILPVTEDVEVFEKDALVIPINMKLHWATAVILNPIGAVTGTKNTKSKHPCTIVIFDSNRGPTFNPIVTKRLMQWLEVCFDKQYNEDGAKFMEKNIKIAVPKGVPQQDNGNDCGPFSCNFASNIFASFEYLIEQNRNSKPIEWTKMSKVALTPATVRQQLFDDIMSFATNEARDYVNGYNLGLLKLETSERKVAVSAKNTRCEVQPSDSTSPDNSPPNKRQKRLPKAESTLAASNKEQKLQDVTSTRVTPPTDESLKTENELLMKLDESLSNSVIRRAHLFGVGSKDVESIKNSNSELTENSLFRLLYSRVEEYNKNDSNPNFALYHPNFLEKEFLILPENRREAHVLQSAHFAEGGNKPNQVIMPILRNNNFAVAVFVKRQDKSITMHLLNPIVGQLIWYIILQSEALEFAQYYFNDKNINVIKIERAKSNQVQKQRVTSKDRGIWCVINTENYMENFKIPIKTLSDMNLVAPQNVDIEEIRKKLAKEVAKISEEEKALTSSSQKPFTAATEKEQKLQDATATLVTPPTNESRMTENKERIEIVKSYLNDPALRHLYLFKLEDMDADEIKNDEKEITVNATFRLLEKRVCEHNAHNEKFAIFHPIFLNDEYGIMPDDEKADLITKCVFFADGGRPERFLLPIYRRFHFALVAFGRDKDHNVNVHLYDSLFDPDATIMFEKNEAEQFAKHYYDNVNSVTFERGTVEQVEPQRRGSKDCGVFLVLNAERVLNKNALPLGRISTMNRHIPLTETNTYQVRQQFSAEIKKIHKKDKDLTSSTPEPPISTIDMSDMSSEASSSDEEESHSESEQIASEASLSNTPVTPKSRSPQYDSMSDLDGTTLSAVQSVDMKQEKERSDSTEVTYDKSSETRLSLAKQVHSDSKKIASEASSSATPVTPKTQIVQPDKSSETRLSHAKKVHSDSKKKIASEAISSATPVTPKTRIVQPDTPGSSNKETAKQSNPDLIVLSDSSPEQTRYVQNKQEIKKEEANKVADFNAPVTTGSSTSNKIYDEIELSDDEPLDIAVVYVKKNRPREDESIIIKGLPSYKEFPNLPNCRLLMLDVATLTTGTYINDNIVTAGYTLNLVENLEPSRFGELYIARTDLVKKLVEKPCLTKTTPKAKDYLKEDLDDPLLQAKMKEQCNNVLPQTRKVEVFSKDMLIFPVNINLHWVTVIVINPAGSIAGSTNPKSKLPCSIVVFDSARIDSDVFEVVTTRLTHWMEACFNEKNKETDAKFQPDRIRLDEPTDLPQQKNYVDCGPFSCNFAANIFASFEYLMVTNNKEGQFEWGKMEIVTLDGDTIRQQLFEKIMSFAEDEARAHVDSYELGLDKLNMLEE